MHVSLAETGANAIDDGFLFDATILFARKPLKSPPGYRYRKQDGCVGDRTTGRGAPRRATVAHRTQDNPTDGTKKMRSRLLGERTAADLCHVGAVYHPILSQTECRNMHAMGYL
jgi:hypothetical protein